MSGTERKSTRFNPDSEEISDATFKYLLNGGKISQAVTDWGKTFEDFVNLPADAMEAQEFLRG